MYYRKKKEEKAKIKSFKMPKAYTDKYEK